MIRTINSIRGAHWTTKAFISFLFACWLMLLYIGYLIFWPFKTMDVQNLPYPVLNSPVEAGQIVVWEVDSCRYTQIAADVTRTLVGEVTIQLNRENQTLEKGCSKYRVATTIIPSYTPEGEYHIEIAAIYKINPIRQIDRQFRTQKFRVVRPPRDAEGNEVVSPPRVIRLQGDTLQPDPSAEPQNSTIRNREPAVEDNNDSSEQNPRSPSQQLFDCLRQPIKCIDEQP